MAKLGISTGTVPNDGTGDSLLDGAVKINSNFDEIYTYFGDGTNLSFSGGKWITTAAGIHTLSNVGIGTTDPQYKLHVVGSFAATTKSFVIDHPTKKGMKLRYGSLEGPENGVYVRGRTQNNIIEFPNYWINLIEESSITVNLTPIGESATPRVRKIENNTVEVFSKEEGELDYFYIIFAERKDVPKLEVEF